MALDKTKYTEVAGGSMTDRTWPSKESPIKVGDSVEGRYIEKRVVNTQNGSANIYVVHEDGGEKVGVWGSSVIDSKMATIAIGKMVAIEYLGEEKSKKGGRTYKNFYVGSGIDSVGDEPNF